MTKHLGWIALLGICVSLNSAIAQQFGMERLQIAYIVGNKDYQAIQSLRNTENDAEDIAEAIEDYGFQPRLHVNQSVGEFDQTFGELLDDLSHASERGMFIDVFFYFAGHGVEIDGQNLLLPIDVRPSSGGRFTARGIERQSIALDDVLRELSANSHRVIVVLDSCREDPFLDSQSDARSIATARFASPPRLAIGTIVFYCAGLNQVARDYLPTDDPFARSNGVCTRHFLDVLREGASTFEAAANEVQGRVHEATLPHYDTPQTPAIYDQLVSSYDMNSIGDYGRFANAIAMLSQEVTSADASLTIRGLNDEQIPFSPVATGVDFLSSDLRGRILSGSEDADAALDPLFGTNLSIFFRPDRLEAAQEIANLMNELGANTSVVSTDLAEVTMFPQGTNRIVGLSQLTDQEELVLDEIIQILNAREDEQGEALNSTRTEALLSGPIQIQLY